MCAAHISRLGMRDMTYMCATCLIHMFDITYKALLSDCRALLSDCRALLSDYVCGMDVEMTNE